MKILFLDIDGVLNSEAFIMSAAGGRFMPTADMIDPVAVAALNEILAASGAHVVVSSTWRRCFGREALRAILVAKGFTGTIIGETPMHFGHRPRGSEIRNWLENRLAYDVQAMPIDGMVILDDADDMVDVEPWVVRTTWESGLLPEHVGAALEILGRPAWKPTI